MILSHSPVWTGLIILAAASSALFGQTRAMTQGANRMELTLEFQDKSGWRVVDPGYVFGKDDQLRFRFKTNFAGHLYVMNHGTSGTYTRLFPRQDTGTENRVVAGKEYLVPATGGSFRVEGPGGFDILYWVMTPEKSYKPLPPPPPATGGAPSNLRPRCDDSILRARGECVDSSAGAQAVDESRRMPSNLKSVPAGRSRQLVFLKEQEQSVVSSPEPLAGPVVYEFRLAHR